MDRAAVVAAIAGIARKPAAEIADHALLASLGVSSSLGLSLLRTRLESEIGRALEPLSGNLLVGELVALLADGTAAAPVNGGAHTRADAVPEAEPAWRGNIGLGIDIQDVESMPLTNDYRSHEFYSSHFSPGEIATALLRPDTRLHLCGIFSAKEAAKKSHPLLLEMRMDAFTVTHAPNGKPLLTISEQERLPYRFQFIISVSHTTKLAAAACMTTWSDRTVDLANGGHPSA